MPTGATSDLLPVRKATKERLARLKGGATYDALLRVLLDLAPEEAVRARLQGGPATPVAEARARPPEKQLLIARLAAQRWRALLESGALVERGPRLYAWKARDARPAEVRYAIVPRRGLAP